MVRFIFGFVVLFFVSICSAKTLPFEVYQGVFTTNTESPDINFDTNEGTEYLLPIRVFLNEHPYLYYPDFEVGILDEGIFLNHADFHPFSQGYLGGNQSSLLEDDHGTMMSSLFALSQVGDNIGTHGIVNAKVNFMDRGSFNDEEYFREFLRVSKNSKIINISIALDLCNTYQVYRRVKELGSITRCPHLNENSEHTPENIMQHIQNVQGVRSVIQNNPDRLFVFAAGNSGLDARGENGAIHYAVDTNGNPYLNKLNNVLVVANLTSDGILDSDSNYGPSVDVAVSGKAYGALSVDDGQSIFDTRNGTSVSSPITSGIAALLGSADSSLTPSQLKQLLVYETSQYVSYRYTGNGNNTEVISDYLPIPDLQSSYTVLKNRLQIETYQDINALSGVDITASNDVQCINVWNAGGSPRSVVGSGKSYEAKFYGDRCLFFRGNSYIIDFDLTTKTATRQEFSDYSANKFREYMTFRNLTNNLQSAQNNESWRNGYEVEFNTSEKVGCTTADNCVNGNITTVEQCTNLFKAITGDYPNVMGSSQTALKSQNVCTYETSKVIVEYDANSGEVKVVKKGKSFEEYYAEFGSKVQWAHQQWISRGKPQPLYLPDDTIYFLSNGALHGWTQNVSTGEYNDFFEKFGGEDIHVHNLGWVFKYTHKESGESFFYDRITGALYKLSKEEIASKEKIHLEYLREVFAVAIDLHKEGRYDSNHEEYNLINYNKPTPFPLIQPFIRTYGRIFNNTYGYPACTDRSGVWEQCGNVMGCEDLSWSIYMSFIRNPNLYDSQFYVERTETLGKTCKFHYNNFSFTYDSITGTVSPVQ